MREPYRVMVWGPGGMGAICIWEVLQSPAFKLVGVRAYGESKHGVDIGTLLGIDPIGIAASTHLDELLKVDCDCIIYTARDYGNFNTDEEILTLLAAGKNVVTPLPYQNAHLFRDAAFSEKLAAACKQGGSVFHSTGIDPDLISERVLMALTGLCTDIRYIKLQENWECGAAEPEPLAVVGFGRPVEEAKRMGTADGISTNFLKAIAYTVEHVLGVHYDRVVETHDYIATPKDIENRLPIKAGTVARVSHRIEGYIDAKGKQPFFTMEYNWLMDHSMLPEGVLPGQYWVAEIEGRPSMKMVIDLKASNSGSERFYQVGKFSTEPGYHGTIAPCLQAIPHICGAAPGVLPSFGPGLHWMQDLRDSVPS